MNTYTPEKEEAGDVYSRLTLGKINQGLAGILINLYVESKYLELSDITYKNTLYLPSVLIKDYLKDEVIRTNRLISENPEWFTFDRPLLFVHEKEKDNAKYCVNKYSNLEHLINGFSEEEVSKYLNYSFVEHNIYELELELGFEEMDSAIEFRAPINLPQINELIDYLAYNDYYKWLLDNFNIAINGGEIYAPKKHTRQQEYRFETIFPDSVPDLFDELNNRKMITGNKDHFIWAFGIGKEKPTDFKPIIWKRDNTLLAYLIDKFCINYYKWKAAEIIFGIGGLSQSLTNCKGNPRGKKLIDEIKQEIG